MGDWRDRFRVPQVRHVARAADRPDRGVVLSDLDGPIEAYAWDIPAGTLRRATTQGIATLVAGISPDGATLVHLRDTTGDEHGHLHAAPFEGGDPVDLTPGLPQYVMTDPNALAVTDDGAVFSATVDGAPNIGMVAGDAVRLVPFTGLVANVMVVGDLVAVSTPMAGRGLLTEVVLLDLATLEEVGRVPEALASGVLGDRLGLGVVRDGWLRPAVRHEDGSVEDLDVELPGEVVPVAAHGAATLLRSSYRSVDGLAVLDTDGLRRLAVPLGVLGSGSGAGFDGGRASAVVSTARLPATVVEVDEQGHRPMLDVAATCPGATWEEHEVTGGDGVPVQVWLLRPEGDGPHPTVLNGHGGPTAVQGPRFDPIAQAWVDRGYAYASVNYRGSTGFGEEFREALTGDIGGPELRDMVATRRWLVASGVADPERIVLNGYSYGGYLTCMLLGTHPDLWAAGIAGAPIVDWPELHATSRSTRSYAETMFPGDPDTRRAAMVAASPTSVVDDVQAPLLVSAPAEDDRTPLGPVRRYVERLAARDHPVELQVLSGGHAGVGRDQTTTMVERWLAFADRHVGGADD